MADPRDLTNLDALFQTRISQSARKMAHDRAVQDGIKDATWLRKLIYRELGLLKRSRS